MKYALGVILVILAGWAITGQLGWSRAKAAAETRRADLEEVRGEMEALRAGRDTVIAAREELDERRRADSAELAGELTRTRARLTRATASSRAQTLRLDSLLAADSLLPDTVRGAIGAAFRSLTEENVACRASLDLADSLHSLCGQRLASRDSTIADLRLTVVETDSLLHAQTALTETYRSLASPPWYERLRRGLPWIAGAVGLGVVVGLALGG